MRYLITILLLVLCNDASGQAEHPYNPGPGICWSDGFKAPPGSPIPVLSVDFSVVATKGDLAQLGWAPEVRVTCPACVKAKLRSIVRGDQNVASMRLFYYPTDSYYDEDGRYHLHGGAPPATRDYVCSRGHKWTVTGPKLKCWCGHE